ncbi:MAG: acyl-CoA dehydratase activase [Chitinophagales bacterium]
MYFAGVDVGSVAAKCVILGGDRLLSSAIVPTGWSPKEAGRQVFEAALRAAGVQASAVARVVGTGYGRVALDFLDQAVTEITCHAVGAHRLFPDNDAVVDIGGQDSKAIKVGPGGKVLSFAMNDKCAAGTGRFLQVMATTLGLEFDDLESVAAAEPASINSMCTVFAESEVVSLLAAGTPKERIIAGLYQSIARRVASMAGSLGTISGVTFTGGVARSSGVRLALARALGCPVTSPPEPEYVGALGAAVIAARLNE